MKKERNMETKVVRGRMLFSESTTQNLPLLLSHSFVYGLT